MNFDPLRRPVRDSSVAHGTEKSAATGSLCPPSWDRRIPERTEQLDPHLPDFTSRRGLTNDRRERPGDALGRIEGLDRTLAAILSQGHERCSHARPLVVGDLLHPEVTRWTQPVEIGEGVVRFMIARKGDGIAPLRAVGIPNCQLAIADVAALLLPPLDEPRQGELGRLGTRVGQGIFEQRDERRLSLGVLDPLEASRGDGAGRKSHGDEPQA